jgi:Tol biopolymer transport system component
VVTTPASETHPTFSPDGRWLMYVVGDGDASGVYVRPFPGPGRVERIAREGSTPIWAFDGKSILFESIASPPNPAAPAASQITRVSIDTSGDRVTIGSVDVFATPAFTSSTPVSGFDISPDNQRVLVTMTAPRPAGGAAVSPALQLTLHANLARAARK